jgi:hypothetical protein
VILSATPHGHGVSWRGTGIHLSARPLSVAPMATPNKVPTAILATFFLILGVYTTAPSAPLAGSIPFTPLPCSSLFQNPDYGCGETSYKNHHMEIHIKHRMFSEGGFRCRRIIHKITTFLMTNLVMPSGKILKCPDASKSTVFSFQCFT